MSGRIAALFALVLAAVYFGLAVLWHRSATDGGAVAYDFYGQFYPYAVHAWRSLHEGSGLFWNPYQDCGQPFFGIIHIGLLYPVNLVFGALDREPAMIASVILNLTIAGVGTFQLCRAIGAGTAAALCGALAFELGWATANLAAWSPTHLGPFAWLPVAMWRSERLVREPSLRRGLLLAIVLAIQILPGFPEIVFFTYQLIALRILWALLFRQTPHPRTLLGATAVGLVLPLFLTAVQLVPSFEVARASLRSGSLSARDLGPGFSWVLLRKSVASHVAIEGNALVVMIAMLAVVAASWLRRWTATGFYLFVVIVYFVLSLGPGSLLFDLYARLPLSTAFRGPARLLWITSFALSVLAGLGAEAVISASSRLKNTNSGEKNPETAKTSSPATLAGEDGGEGADGSDGLAAQGRAGLRPAAETLTLPLSREQCGRGGLARKFTQRLVRWPTGTRGSKWTRLTAVALPLLVFWNGATVKHSPVFGLRRGDVYGAHADVFAFVRARLTAQDRVLIVSDHPDLGLMPKSATLFRVPNIHDYEGMASRAYAEFFTFMRTGHGVRNLDDWYWLFRKLLPTGLRRPLFDLTAARYLIVAQDLDRTAQAFPSGLRLLLDRDGVRVYENPQAVPRVRYVPRVTVVREDEVLPTLAGGMLDLRRVAVVSQAPPSGFTGSEESASGSVEIVADEPERVVVRVHATRPGFLFLADQYFPGWTAKVNGEERQILRADHVFRLVEVPAGESEVEFTYRPLSVRLGACISLASVAVVLVWRKGISSSRTRSRSQL